MEKIASFTIDHIRLQPGLYVSRKDKVGENVVTTFDLRMTLSLIHILRFLPGMFLHKALREISLFFRKLNGKLHK